MKYQYSATNSLGKTWIDATGRENEFISAAAKYHGHTVEQIKQGLADGYEIKTGPEWDAAYIRDAEQIKPATNNVPDSVARGTISPDGVDDTI